MKTLGEKVLLTALLLFSVVQVAEMLMVAYAVYRFFQWLNVPII